MKNNKQKLVLVLVLIAIVIAVSAVAYYKQDKVDVVYNNSNGTSSTSTNPNGVVGTNNGVSTSGGKYSNAGFNFSINYPDASKVYMENGPVPEVKKIHFGAWGIVVYEEQYRSKERVVKDMEELFKDDWEITTSKIAFNGIQATKMELDYINKEQPHMLHIIFTGPKYTYDIYGEPSSSFEVFYQSFQLSGSL